MAHCALATAAMANISEARKRVEMEAMVRFIGGAPLLDCELMLLLPKRGLSKEGRKCYEICLCWCYDSLEVGSGKCLAMMDSQVVGYMTGFEPAAS